MKAEYEAKFLEIDVAAVQKTLCAKGGIQVYPRQLFKRLIFENEFTRATKSWIRLRDEYGSVKVTWKCVGDPASIHGVKEIEVSVDGFDLMGALLERIGMERINYQENYREHWTYNDVVFDFDTWPGIPTFVEIEGPSEGAVKKAAAEMGFDYRTAMFGSIDHLYRERYQRDILKEPRLVFKTPTTP